MEEKEGVVHEYWRQNCLVPFKIVTTPGLFMRRRERKKAPNKTQTKYTGLDIPYVVRERRELFEFAQKINKRRDAVGKLVWQYIAKKCSREEAMKLMRPLTAKERSVVVGARKSIGPPLEILVRSSSTTTTITTPAEQILSTYYKQLLKYDGYRAKPRGSKHLQW